MLSKLFFQRQLILILMFIFLFCQYVSPLVYNEEEVSQHLFYDSSQITDAQIKTCINNAIHQINNGTCINLHEINSMINHQLNKTSIYLQQNEKGLCGIDADNSSLIYLTRECVLNDHNACIHLISKYLTRNKSITTNIISSINEHFECNEHCQLSCLNGGKLDVEDNSDRCISCSCPFNGLFEGQTCNELIKLGEYTDEACKTIIVGTDEWNGEIKLKSPLNEKTYCQIMLVADDPWAKLEIEFSSLDMSRRFAGAVDCPDRLQVYGLEASSMKSIKCNSPEAPKPREHFISKSNFLLFQLDANRFDKTPRLGPIIRYTLRPAVYSAAIRTQRISSNSRNYADETMFNDIDEGSDNNNTFNFLNGIGGTTFVIVAVALACITAILVLAAFAAFGRRRRILRNRRYRHHQNNGSNGTSSTDKRRNSCASSVKSGEKVTVTNEIEEPAAKNGGGVNNINTTSTVAGGANV
jgi:hypothetical protein